jgi:peptidyl-prolyl cis-trans isomerase B (cyclophilin B)
MEVKDMKTVHLLSCAAVVLMFAVLVSGVSFAQEGSKVQAKQPAPAKGQAATPAEPDEIAVMDTNYGTFYMEFFPKDAPNHVRNFKKLARSGFYDGTKFHRVIKGFMIQGGDPLTKGNDTGSYGTGGPGYSIDAEFNSRPHLKGTLSMARAASPNSAGSQFFICLEDKPFLNGQYTVFGRVIKGMGVVEKIGNVPVKGPEPSIPVEPVVLKKVTIIPRAEFKKMNEKAEAKPEQKAVPKAEVKPAPKTDSKATTGK